VQFLSQRHKYKGQEKELLESIFQKYSVSINDRLRFLALNETKAYSNLNAVEHSDYPPSEVNSKPNNKLLWSILVGIIFVLGVIAVWWYQHDNEPENRNVPVNASSGKVTEVETEVSAITKPTKATNQMPTALFSIESGIEDERQIVAVPFVIYSNGKYEAPLIANTTAVKKKH
jgi:hypothetical protein